MNSEMQKRAFRIIEQVAKYAPAGRQYSRQARQFVKDMVAQSSEMTNDTKPDGWAPLEPFTCSAPPGAQAASTEAAGVVIVLPETRIDRDDGKEKISPQQDLLQRIGWAISDCDDDEKTGIAAILAEAKAMIERFNATPPTSPAPVAGGRVEISDTMINAALDAWFAGWSSDGDFEARMQSAIRAALASPSTPSEPVAASRVDTTVDRVYFDSCYGAFAVTQDGKRWRLSSDEIKNALNAQPILDSPSAPSAEPVAWRQSDEAIRNMIAKEIWRYQECEEAYGAFDDNANESKQTDLGMRSLIKQTAIDQAELIRAVVLASPVVRACFARLINEDECYDIGKRDGYEDAVQDFDLATGGDGEFKSSTIPGTTVDVPVMKARVIARFARQGQPG